MGTEKPMRILCAREIQRSIKQSVHTLLKDQVQALDLGDFYEVIETSIRGKNGTEFTFSGLATNTVESIKSFEGVDIVWCEEAQNISKRSWDILIPTVRKPSSEIWITFNPYMDTDETYKRFVINKPPNARVEKVNYNDNFWFPKVLEIERNRCLQDNPLDYPNIWLGDTKAAADGAIYHNEIREAQESGRITNIPSDALLKTHVVMDLGWNDSMAIILCQRSLSEIRIINYIEDDHRTLDSYSDQLKKLNHNWGTMYLPHDAINKDFKYGTSAEQIMQRLGWDTEVIPRASIETGIKVARMTFDRAYFDANKTKRLIECLKNYRRSINSTTNEPAAPLHDSYSHGADAWRYVCAIVDGMSNEESSWEKPLEINKQWIV
jgi:phage terminase large subunit|tara:strand:- start:12 stop:1148 length:1137 start_codon:yes stop_codon:yes gene_type:complete